MRVEITTSHDVRIFYDLLTVDDSLRMSGWCGFWEGGDKVKHAYIKIDELEVESHSPFIGEYLSPNMLFIWHVVDLAYESLDMEWQRDMDLSITIRQDISMREKD